MPTLTSDQKASLRKANARQIENALVRVKGHTARGYWLDTSNPYKYDCIAALSAHTQPGQSVTSTKLAEYIAASAPLHCVDGWSLLGRALDAYNREDTGTTTHLAYYAELRAAMSLLASEGIGIFNDRHFVVQSTGHVDKLPTRGSSRLGTHDIAWLALEHWSTLVRSCELFRNTIQPSGIPLGDWIDAFGVSPMSRPIAQRWLRAWGLDLKRLSEGQDRYARNQASYRPTHLNPRASLGALRLSSFVRGLWEICEPSPSSTFDSLDRYLLRCILERSSRGLRRRSGPIDQARVTRMLNAIIPGNPRLYSWWLDFLMRKINTEDPEVIKEASAARGRSTDSGLRIVARAALLLRVASGACSRLLKNSFLTRADLEFWWRPLGERCGLWEPGNEPDHMTDLWQDINASLQDLREWETINGVASSNASWRRKLIYQIAQTGEAERIALWSLGL